MKKYIAEFIGTFALVFCGTGSIIINEIAPSAVTHIGISVTFGLIVMAMIYSIGKVSGAHLNPAVSIAFAVSKSFAWKEVVPYVIAQIAGAFAASLTLKFLFPHSVLLGATIPSGSVMQSFIMEVILSFFLMFVILQVAIGPKEQGITAGLAIGAVILLEAMFAGPISGASMNPARSLAPAVVSGHMQYVWLYLAAPVTGALIAVIFHRLLK